MRILQEYGWGRNMLNIDIDIRKKRVGNRVMKVSNGYVLSSGKCLRQSFMGWMWYYKCGHEK